MELYKPDKYKVFTGKGNLALCTCWSDPETLIKNNHWIKEKFRITGTLYSREGISIIIRNLCINPQISHLFLWSHDALSRTKFGTSGSNVLKKLWENGVGDDNMIIGTDCRIHREIDVSAIRKIIQNVALVDVSEKEINELQHEIQNVSLPETPCMKPISFPEPVRDASEPFPSEEIGWVVHGNKVVDVWLKVVDRIVRYGEKTSTEYGSNQKQLQAVSWAIDNEDAENPCIPDWPENLLESIGLEKKSLEKYSKTFLDPELPENVYYTYGQRLRNLEGKDQVNEIIKKLKSRKQSRRGVATVLVPGDINIEFPPCLNHMQAAVSKDKLNLIALFRSHDIFKAAIPNAFGLLELQKYIADSIGCKAGKLCIISNTAHIYEEDWQSAEDIVKCQVWNSAKLYFDENEADPRGIVRVSTSKDNVTVEIISNGEQLFEFSAKTARQAILKIAKLDLLSQADHYADIAIELTKAELAMKLNLKFTQDKPLEINDVAIR